MSSRILTVSGIVLTLDNGHQILNMGGPWIADISIGSDLVSNDCIADNIIYKEDIDTLFFVKFHLISTYRWYFSIRFYKISNRILCEFERPFDIVHLGNVTSENRLEIYPAFHGEFKNTIQIFNLDDEDFNQIN